jgi:hypothetical protein
LLSAECVYSEAEADIADASAAVASNHGGGFKQSVTVATENHAIETRR